MNEGIKQVQQNKPSLAVRRNELLLLASTMSICALPILPVIVPYYKNQLGLSFEAFLIGEAMFALTMVLMEIPSGWLSDVWRRKFMLIIACTLEAIGFLVLIFAFDFWSALLGQVIIGIGLSFSSGTVSALLYDDLLHHGREDEYRKLEGRRHGMGMFATGIAGLAGGFLYEIDPYLPIWLTFSAGLLGLFFVLFIKEPPRVKEAVKGNPIKDVAIVLHDCVRGNKEIAALLFFVSVVFGATQAGHWMQQPYYIALEIPEALFGVFAATGFIIAGFGGTLGHHLERFFRPVHILVGLWVALIVCWTLSAATLWYHALFLLMISNAAFGLGWPVVNDAINKRVSSARRATYLSVAALMRRLTFVPLGFVIGWMTDDYGVQVALFCLAAFVLVANIWNVRRLLFPSL